MQTTQDPRKILDARQATGIGTPMHVADFNHTVLQLNTTGTTTATVKFQVSYQKSMPDFNAAQSPTNQWDYVRVIDLEDGSSIDGDVGIALAGADDNRILEVNTNGANWINGVVTAYTQGVINLSGTAKTE